MLYEWKKLLMIVIGSLFVMMPLSSAITNIEHANRLESDESYCIEYTVEFFESDFSFDKQRGYDVITLSDGDFLDERGRPMMPLQPIKLALPNQMSVEQIQVLNTEYRVLDGKYNILPAQLPLRISQDASEADFVMPDLAIYKSSEPFPSKIVRFLHQSDLAGQGIANIVVYPMQYVPVEQKLIFYTSITFKIECSNSYIYGDYLPRDISEGGMAMYEQMVKGMVVNSEDVKLQVSSENYQTTGVEPGNYDYVIITDSSWIDDFQPLADWKTKKGIPTKIVTVSWIENNGGYSGTSQEKIRAFVEDAHLTWGTIYFLLGGDTNIVPYQIIHYYIEFADGWEHIYAPADTYYADYDDDWVCEIHIGRSSVRDTSMIDTFIDKIFTYEKNPPLTNYAKKAALFGFDSDDETPGEELKIYIDDYYIPSDWVMSNVYDSDGGNHESNVKAAINDGQNLVNHIDHADEYSMGAGSYNHNYWLSTTEVDNFYNDDKQSILYSIGCWAAAFDFTNCIAEHFVRDTNGGCVGFIGNSRYGIYTPGYTDRLSLKFDKYFFRSLFSQGHYTLGECFSDSKNDVDTYNDAYKLIFHELNLLGDPQLQIWTENPNNIDVAHDTEITGSQPQIVTVHVEDGGGLDLPEATVCLWKEGDVYEIEETNSNGDVDFSLPSLSAGTLYVTVSKHNYKPVESEITVTIEPGSPNAPNSPSPINNAISVFPETDLFWDGGDPDPGDTVTYDIYFGSDGTPPHLDTIGPFPATQIDLTYDPGTLNLGTTYWWRIIAHDNHGHTTNGPLWSFNTLLDDYMIVESATGTPGQNGLVVQIEGKWTIELGSYQIALFYDTDQIEIVDITFDGTLGGTAAFAPINISTPGRVIAAAVWMPPNFPYPPPGSGMLCNVIINIKPGATLGETILDLDDYLGEPSVKCKYTPPGGSAGDEVYPELVDGILTITDSLCGDADMSGDVDIDDVVYLINYIFAGGPPPQPEECNGDANGSENVDIDDVVYLIAYIFSGGPPPVLDCCG